MGTTIPIHAENAEGLTTFSSKGIPAAKGVEFTLKYSGEWKKADLEKDVPVVLRLGQEWENAAAVINVTIQESETKKPLDAEGMKQLLPRDATLLDAKPHVLEFMVPFVQEGKKFSRYIQANVYEADDKYVSVFLAVVDLNDNSNTESLKSLIARHRNRLEAVIKTLTIQDGNKNRG